MLLQLPIRVADAARVSRFAVILLLVTACADAAVTTTSPDEAGAAITATAPATTTTTSAAAVSAEAAAADFLVAVDAQLDGTSYEGEALNAPEVFLATGRFFCDQLDDSVSVDEILSEYVAELVGVPIEDAPDDDLVLAGSVVGAAVGNLCPEHADVLTG